jgi:hypothetical protein
LKVSRGNTIYSYSNILTIIIKTILTKSWNLKEKFLPIHFHQIQRVDNDSHCLLMFLVGNYIITFIPKIECPCNSSKVSDVTLYPITVPSAIPPGGQYIIHGLLLIVAR